MVRRRLLSFLLVFCLFLTCTPGYSLAALADTDTRGKQTNLDAFAASRQYLGCYYLVTEESTNDGTPVRSYPREGENVKGYVRTGTRLYAKYSGTNAVDNLWYLLGGKTYAGGYIYSGRVGEDPDQNPIYTVKLRKDSYTISRGSELTLSASCTSDGDIKRINKDVTWVTSDNAVLSFKECEYRSSNDTSGTASPVFVAKKPGMVSVRCVGPAGVLASCTVVVRGYVPSEAGWGFTHGEAIVKTVSKRAWNAIFSDNLVSNELYELKKNKPAEIGICHGLAVSSILAYCGYPSVTDWKSSAIYASELHAGDLGKQSHTYQLTLSEYIQAMWVSQFTNEVKLETEANKDKYKDIIERTNTFNQTDKNPIAIILKHDKWIMLHIAGKEVPLKTTIGHVLIPYRTEESDTTVKVYVYDCSKGTVDDAYIVFDKNSVGWYTGWSYVMEGNYTWNSDVGYISYIDRLPELAERIGISKSPLMPLVRITSDKAILTYGNSNVIYCDGYYSGAEEAGLIPVESNGVLYSEVADADGLFFVPNNASFDIQNDSGMSNVEFTYVDATSKVSIRADGNSKMGLSNAGTGYTFSAEPSAGRNVSMEYTTAKGVVMRIEGETDGVASVTIDSGNQAIVSGFGHASVLTSDGSNHSEQGIDGAWPHEVLIPDAVVDDTMKFADVLPYHYFYNAVLWAFKNGITTGTTDTTFSPYDTVTRGQAVTFLWRAAGKPAPVSRSNPFADVSEVDYYYDSVLWALENGITNGVSDDTFAPGDTCTNAHILTFLYRTMGEPNGTTSGGWYGDALTWANGSGLLKDTSAFSDVMASCPRSDVLTFLYRALV